MKKMKHHRHIINTVQIKTNTLAIFFTLLVILPFNVCAEDDQKHFSVGVGGLFLGIVDDDNSRNDTDFSGGTLSIFYAPTHEWATRVEFYSMDNNDNSDFEMDGYTLSGYIGVGLTSPGLKIYVGGGYFNETLESDFTRDIDFDGLQVNGGIGYNWNLVALDVLAGIRDTSDYEDSIFDEPSAATISIILSIRL
jgi:hypothetical protein